MSVHLILAARGGRKHRGLFEEGFRHDRFLSILDVHLYPLLCPLPFVDDQVVPRRHCEAKGYREGDGVNNFAPHDPVAAFAMARALLGSNRFDRFVAVAPEGHIYGYFFERLGAEVLEVFTDYPPTRCASRDELSVLKGARVLLIEDDVIGGGTLRLVAGHLRQFSPAALAVTGGPGERALIYFGSGFNDCERGVLYCVEEVRGGREK